MSISRLKVHSSLRGSRLLHLQLAKNTIPKIAACCEMAGGARVSDDCDLLRAPRCTQRGGRGQMAGRDGRGGCQAALVTPITHTLGAGTQQVTVALTST